VDSTDLDLLEISLGKLNKLTALRVTKAKPGMHADGGGLYLRVGASGAAGAKSWIFRYSVDGKERYLGLGSAASVKLAQARKLATDARALRAEGKDPIAHRRVERREAALAKSKTITFAQAAKHYIAAHEHVWRNAKHRQQWSNTVKTYANPIIGALPVQDINLNLIVQVLQPIWATKPETAARLRGRIERILGWAKVNGYRAGENPARWKDNLDHALAPRDGIRKARALRLAGKTTTHQPALPYSQIPAFMTALRQQPGVAARALEFAILTAARSGEVRAMSWTGELDTAGKIWIVPPARMKGEREHRVPLTHPALSLIERMRDQQHGDYVFPSANGETLSDMALIEVIRRMNEQRDKAGLPHWIDPKEGNRNVVPHGFRSSFRDWVSEVTSFSDVVAEAALAHAKGDKVEGAYQRGTMFEKRRKLMDAWARFCASSPTEQNNVVAMR
jgi:integrase